MKPKIRGRSWWGRGLKNSWTSQSKMHSSSMKIGEFDQQVKEFLKGETIGKTKKSIQSEKS